MSRKVLILQGHPNPDSYCAALAKAYQNGAQAAGLDVRLLQLIDLRFDPILRASRAGDQPLEPDLVACQQHLAWADHVVFVFPIWWGSMPALLKGFLDRIMTQGFAYRYREKSLLWDKMLSGRTAELIVTMNTPPWFFQWVYRDAGLRGLTVTTLGFSGIKTTRITRIGMIRRFSEAQRSAWLAKIHHLAQSTPSPRGRGLG